MDTELNVYGTMKLKVTSLISHSLSAPLLIVDMSIVLFNIVANMYSMALVIGEKASLIIADELGWTPEP